jgi:DNA-binding NarL/FixJ family response regulator
MSPPVSPWLGDASRGVTRMPNSTGKPVRILIAEDHTMFRKGLCAILEAAPDIEVVGEASDGQEAVQVARVVRPDVILMDVRMPRLDGVAATWIIKHELPDTQVILISMFQADEDVIGGLKAGAHGYVLKESPPEDLIRAIQLVHQGQAMIDSKVAGRLLLEFARLPERSAAAADHELYERLTAREREVLELVARGHTNSRLAEALSISLSTVKAHLRSIYRKLHVNSRLQAALVSRAAGAHPQTAHALRET